jgi:hypothetical protein
VDQLSQLPQAAQIFVGILACCVIPIVLIIAIIIWCRIFAKTGYGWAFGLLMFVPIANIIMYFVLAFGDWPIQKEVRELRERVIQLKMQQKPF